MERIKQALELARQQREKQKSSAVEYTSDTGVVADMANGTGVAEEKIEYTETRSINIDAVELRKRRILIDQQNSVADAYRILRTQVLQNMRENRWNTLAVTSPKSGEGKTLTAINLAVSLAREVDYTVLLVDANLRNPSIDKQMDVDSKYGLSDYLTNDVPLNEILIHPRGISKFVVLPAGKPLANSSEMLSSPKMARLVDELKHRYPSRIVIFDLPPVLTSSDAIAFSPLIDATLVVIEEGGTLKQELKQAFEMLRGAEVLGTVLNKAYSPDKDYGDVGLKDGLISRFIKYIARKKRRDLSVQP